MHNGRWYSACLKSTEKRGLQNTKDAMLGRSLYSSCAPAVSCGELAAWGSGGDAEGRQQERGHGPRKVQLRHRHHQPQPYNHNPRQPLKSPPLMPFNIKHTGCGFGRQSYKAVSNIAVIFVLLIVDSWSGWTHLDSDGNSEP